MSGTLQGTGLWNSAELGGEGAAQGAEVVAYDAQHELVFVLGAEGVDALNAADGELVFSIPKSDLLGDADLLGTGNSVAVHGDKLAVAFDGPEQATNGAVGVFTIVADGSGVTLDYVVQPAASDPATFAVPDMVTFTPDGSKLLVAIEGEPADNWEADPLGGVGIIDVATGNLTIAGFEAFDAATLAAAGVRLTGLSGPGAEPGTATAAADLEPEYIAVSADGSTAYVTLQEANAVAVVDIAAGTVTDIFALGTKDHSIDGQGMDASDEDGGINIQTWPVLGQYMPDGIATFEQDGKTYLVTANEGDAREYGDVAEEERLADVTLDPTAFPNAAELQEDDALGRLNIDIRRGDTDGDGDYDQIYAFGARSFSIWEVTDSGLALTYDSGDLIEQTLAAQFPDLLDDTRSDNKGPEPEGVTLGTVDGQLYAFVGLERANSVMAFAIESPTEASFAGLFATEGDVSPEVLDFIPAEDAPEGAEGPVLLVANEVSGTTTAYELEPAAGDGTFTLQILHASDFEAGIAAVDRAKNFAAIVDKLEDEVANSITLSAGDNFLPGPFIAAGNDSSVRDDLISFYAQLLGVPESQLSGLALAPGRVDIAILNAIGIDASAIGNHEFDLGPTAFNDALDFAASGGVVSSIGAMFPYLSANLDFSGDFALNAAFTTELRDAASYATTADDLATPDAIAAEAADKQIAPWTTIEQGGETIGVLGLTTQVLESISTTGNVDVLDPFGDGGVDNMDELAAIIQPYIDQMTALGIDKIILMSHLQQYQNELELATKLHDVDIILSGGSNGLFADETDVLRPGDTADEPYPVFVTDLDGNSTAVMSTDGEYSYVGRLVVTFDADGHIIPDSVDPEVSGAYATTDEMVEELWGDEDAFADGTRGGEVKQLTDAVGAVIEAKDGNVLGFTDVFLEGRRGEVRSEETNLGDLTADANLAAARDTDPTVMVSLKNGGGIRAEIGTIGTGQNAGEFPPAANPDAGKPEGGVSQLDIENALRFNNGLSVVTFTAENLVKVVENALRGVAPGATPGGFPQVGGLEFSFDATRAAGDRVVSLAVVDEDGRVLDVLVQDGELVGDAARGIRTVLLNFQLDSNGDNWMGVAGIPESTVTWTDRVNLYDPSGATDFLAEGREQQALADYLAENYATEDTAFDQADTTPTEDERIQNLGATEDSVLAPRIEFRLLDDGVQAQDFHYTDEAGTEYDASDNDDLTGATGSLFKSTDGDITVSEIDFGGTILTGAPALHLEWNARDAVLEAPGGNIDRAIIDEFTGDSLTLRGFAEQRVVVSNDLDVARVVALEEAGNGLVKLGDGGDLLTVDFTDGSDAVMVFRTFGGNDTVQAAADSTGRMLGGLRDGDDLFMGGLGADTVRGGAGDDTLSGGGAERDVLKGGEGADSFLFLDDTAANDRIVDFASGEDAIVVSAGGFGGGLVAGAALMAAQFLVADDNVATAPAGSGQFVFDQADEQLWWDADGAGAGAALLIAQLRPGATMVAADIQVIA